MDGKNDVYNTYNLTKLLRKLKQWGKFWYKERTAIVMNKNPHSLHYIPYTPRTLHTHSKIPHTLHISP